METTEYTKVISHLDAQLEAARRDWEEHARKIQLEQRLKLIDHQSEGLQKRKEEFGRYGAPVPPELDRLIERLKAEKTEVLTGLRPPPSPFAPVAVPSIPDADRGEMHSLLEELLETELTHMGQEERWTLFEIWALRWRMLAEKVGDDAVQRDSLYKMVYRIVREKMEAGTFCWYIEALNPEKKGNWAVRLILCKNSLTKFAIDRTQKPEEQKDLTGEALEALFAYLRSPAKDEMTEEEWQRQFRHLVRHAARFPHTRDEVSIAVEPYRAVLEPEFGFLWKKEAGHEELKSENEPKKLTNRTIVGRLLRRLRSKGLIGGSHGPYDGIVTQGFPGHQLDLAKTALELLVKAEVVRSKSTNYGVRISIEPREVGRVDGFLNGGKMGVAVVDEWVNGERAA